MGIAAQFLIKNTGMVYPVYPNLPEGMDDVVIAHEKAHMIDLPFLIVKKGQITGGSLLDEVNQ